MAATRQDFVVYAGDHKDVVFTVEDAVAADLAGAKIKWVCAAGPTFRDSPLILKDSDEGEVTISDNTFTVLLVPDDTVDLAPGAHGRAARTYYHEAELETAAGDVSTVATGTLRVLSTVIA